MKKIFSILVLGLLWGGMASAKPTYLECVFDYDTTTFKDGKVQNTDSKSIVTKPGNEFFLIDVAKKKLVQIRTNADDLVFNNVIWTSDKIEWDVIYSKSQGALNHSEINKYSEKYKSTTTYNRNSSTYKIFNIQSSVYNYNCSQKDASIK